jgi:hypothetical protein
MLFGSLPGDFKEASGEMADARSDAGDAATTRRRRRRQPAARRHRVEFSLTDEEFSVLCEAAGRAGLARGAYAARAAVGTALGRQGSDGRQILRETLANLVWCAGQVRQIGENLNQPGGDLMPYAAASVRIAGRLDEAAERVRRAAFR